MAKLMFFKNIIWFCSFLLCSIFLSACMPTLEKGVPAGAKAPDFSTTDLEHKNYKLSDYQGKMVMIYFWADYCPACKKEFPATQKYYTELQEENFELLAINVAQAPSATKKFREKYGATFPMLLDTAGIIAEKYGVQELPVNYFIKPDGTVARRIVGWVDKNQVNVMINQILN